MAQTTFSGPVASQNGFILPSFTNAEIIAIPNPAAGLMVFNSTAGTTAYYDGTEWVGATPPVTSVTYTAGVDYAEGSNLQWSGMSYQISISGMPWTNTTAYDTVRAQPVGTVYTCVASTGSGTITTTGVWGGGGGLETVSGEGTGAFAPAGMGPPTPILSITFTPA